MRLLGVTFTAVACLLLAQAEAGQKCGKTAGCCVRCGETSGCQPKVCQIVCGTKKVKKCAWRVECEDFCVPLPGCRKDNCSTGGCTPVGSCEQGCGETCSTKCLVRPKCGPVRSRKRLVKVEYTIEVPIYKCVVQPLCGGCCEPGAGGVVAEPAKAAAASSRQTLPRPPLPPVVTNIGYQK
jgi:hypothetical protein